MIKAQHCKEDLKFLKWCNNRRMIPKGLELNNEMKKSIPKANIKKVESKIVKEVVKFKRIKERRLSFKCRKLEKKIYKDFNENDEIMDFY